MRVSERDNPSEVVKADQTDILVHRMLFVITDQSYDFISSHFCPGEQCLGPWKRHIKPLLLLGLICRLISRQGHQGRNRYFAMTCVCVGCGTEVKDKEGKPVEKLYDQVANQWKTSFNPIFDRPCWQTRTYWSYWSARSVDKCAIDTLRFHLLFDMLLLSNVHPCPSVQRCSTLSFRFVALWCFLTWLYKAFLPSDMSSSTVAMQEPYSGKSCSL